MSAPLPTLFFVDAPHRIAGAQRSLLAALRAIPAHGIRPLVVFPADGACAEAFRAEGLDVQVLPSPPELLRFDKALLRVSTLSKVTLLARAVLPYCHRLAELIAARGIRAAHFNTARGILQAGLAAKRTGIPAVLHLRGQLSFGGAYRFFAQALADRIVVVARALEREIHPAARHKVVTVYNGVDLIAAPDRERARRWLHERYGLDTSQATFLSLSSPVPFKGLHHLLRAFAQARAGGLRAQLWLAGGSDDASYLRWLERLRDDLGLRDDAHFLGYVEDPLPLLEAADALVLPSVEREDLDVDGETRKVAGNEGLPRSVLEAMAAGRPVIASDIAGVREQIEPGVTGLIVPPGDVDALAGALRRVADDAAWRDQAGAAARAQAARRFSVDAAARGLADVIRGARGHAAASR